LPKWTVPKTFATKIIEGIGLGLGVGLGTAVGVYLSNVVKEQAPKV
jgi:hypothetical protein